MQSTAHEGMEAQGGIGRPKSVFENWRAFCPVLHLIYRFCLQIRHFADGWSGHGGGDAEGQWINSKIQKENNKRNKLKKKDMKA